MEQFGLLSWLLDLRFQVFVLQLVYVLIQIGQTFYFQFANFDHFEISLKIYKVAKQFTIVLDKSYLVRNQVIFSKSRDWDLSFFLLIFFFCIDLDSEKAQAFYHSIAWLTKIFKLISLFLFYKYVLSWFTFFLGPIQNLTKT